MRSKFLTPDYFIEAARLIEDLAPEVAARAWNSPSVIEAVSEFETTLKLGQVEEAFELIKTWGLLPVKVWRQVKHNPAQGYMEKAYTASPIECLDFWLAEYRRDLALRPTYAEAVAMMSVSPGARLPTDHRIPRLSWLRYLIERYQDGEEIAKLLALHRAVERLGIDTQEILNGLPLELKLEDVYG